ncbi:uncharacterized protein [Littorina saxatilis]|uniref:uncharacterized protein n=1 Tax=Littorina saxatilis TaxID=31220 RepID=UPI0038B479B6
MQDSDSKNIAFEVNPMMVLFSHEVGGSYAVLETFSAVVGIPAMHLKTYQRHDKKVTAAEVEAGSAMLTLLLLSMPVGAKKEYAGQRRVNVRAEEARDGNVYGGLGGEH